MAFTGDLGRVQGAGTFHTMAASGTSVARSSLQPQSLTPFVGDEVHFSNGDVRQITGVSGSAITLGEVLWSNKGDPGIGNATLSDIDGDSTVNGFTQAAVKGIAQAKNYYNMGVYDTYVSNGDGTGTISRKTGIDVRTENSPIFLQASYSNVLYYGFAKPKDYMNYGKFLDTGYVSNKFPPAQGGDWDNNSNIGKLFGSASGNVFWIGCPLGTTLEQARQAVNGLIIKYELSAEYQYEEKVIDGYPIRPANQEEELYWHEEWRKGLNLLNNSLITEKTFTTTKNATSNFQVTLREGTTQIAVIVAISSAETNNLIKSGTFTVSKAGEYIIRFGTSGNAEDNFDYYNITLETGVYTCGVVLNSNEVNNKVLSTIMLTRGAVSYPYEDYQGEIVHEKNLSGVQLFSENINPAETIGGDWESLGNITTSTNQTLYAWRKL